ncbi:hypothetical protein [Paenisporosarcina sp. NPDC076898]
MNEKRLEVSSASKNFKPFLPPTKEIMKVQERLKADRAKQSPPKE